VPTNIVNKLVFILEFLHNQELSFPGQEVICEKPEFTVVNEDFEQITDEPRGLKAKVMQELYYL